MWLLLCIGLSPVHAGPWTTINSLHIARSSHTATLLTNGLVLVTGGGGPAGATNSVELFNPNTGLWTVGPSMQAPRYSHTATLLQNGKVLVVGGLHYDTRVHSYLSTNSAELYDPVANTWTNTGSLTVSRADHTATLLPNGKVVVCGGDNGSIVTGSIEVYDPGTQLWSSSGPMQVPRTLHVAALLPNGTVLIASGEDANIDPTNTVEIYDPSTGTCAFTNSMLVGRRWHTATVLNSGKVLVAGGENNGVYLNSAEVYDPTTGTWTAAAPMSTTRASHTETLLSNGSVLVAGGFNAGGPVGSSELYDPALDHWSSAGAMNMARAGHTATLLPSAQVLVAAGSSSVWLTNAELFTLPAFSDIGAGLPGVYRSTIGWGDYDNDGRLDIFLQGIDTNGYSAPPLWRNTGAGFTNDPAFQIQAFGNQGSPWGDFDNDGRLDILSDYTGIWRNTGNAFSNVPADFPVSLFGGTAWGDYDNDGRPDVLMTGYSQGVRYDSFGQAYAVAQTNPAVLWHHTTDGFNPIKAGLPSVYYGTVAWGDYDNDGLPDILLTGIDPTLKPVTQIWRNTGAGFTNINAGLPGVAYGSAAWGDYDNDGRLDILLTGATNLNFQGGAFDPNLGPYEYNDGSTPMSGNPTGYITQVWRNTGSGFSKLNTPMPGVWTGSAVWGDYDNDGNLDILLVGATGSFVVATANNDFFNTTNYQAFATGFISQVWHNTRSSFSIANVGLPGVGYSAAAWGDFDNDGRLDILLSGATAVDGSGTVTAALSQIWRNSLPGANTRSTAPSELRTSISGDRVTFSWNAASDGQTPSGGLSYNLRIGTVPGGSDLVGPMAGSDGERSVVQLANAQHKLSRAIVGLPLGQPIYWSVQAIDTAFAGSPFAAEQTLTFNTVYTPPSGVPVPGDINGDGIVEENELDAVLSNYWPYSPWLYLTNTAGLGGTNVTFALTNSVAGAFSVEYTTDLVNWYYLGPATPRYLFIDTNAPVVPQRFYRLRWP